MLGNDCIDYTEFEKIVEPLAEFVKTYDQRVLQNCRPIIQKVYDVTSTIKTKQEYHSGKEDIRCRTLARALFFLLSYFGEMSCDHARVTIFHDDPTMNYSTYHIGTYQLALHQPETHSHLYCGDQSASDSVYDFDSTCIRQLTVYPNSNLPVDTTSTAYDTFEHCYKMPERTFEFKSYRWTHGSEHSVEYILQLDKDGQFHVLCNHATSGSRYTAREAEFDGIDQAFVNKYCQLTKLIDAINVAKIDWPDVLFNNKIDLSEPKDICPIDLVELDVDGRCPICGNTPEEVTEL